MMMLTLPREQKEILIGRVQNYFETERSEAIGTIAAEQMIDFMIAELGPFLYNHAVTDARRLIAERLMAVEDELYALEKPLPK
ncbi:DUF2164 domain-containing protein [Paenibacillus tarimensis]